MSERYTVVTSFSAEGYALYGRTFMESFEQFWPADVQLLVYAEGCEPTSRRENTAVMDLFTFAPDAKAFIDRYCQDQEANGRKRREDHRWKESALSVGYNYRFDAVRFSRKPFAIEAAMCRSYSDTLIWVDADVVTRAPVTLRFLRSLFPDDAHYSYLGRSTTNSECGFVGYKLPACCPLIEGVANLYRNNTVFGEAEWHDSFLFDVIRGREECLGLKGWDLSKAPRVGDVFSRSILSTCMEHKKGAKKYQVSNRKVMP